MIARAEVIRKINTGEPFSVKVVKLDRKRKTGGGFAYYPKVEKLTAPNVTSETFTTTANGKKHPKHSENATRNLRDLTNGSTVKIHLHLIVLFNGEEVVW